MYNVLRFLGSLMSAFSSFATASQRRSASSINPPRKSASPPSANFLALRISVGLPNVRMPAAYTRNTRARAFVFRSSTLRPAMLSPRDFRTELASCTEPVSRSNVSWSSMFTFSTAGNFKPMSTISFHRSSTATLSEASMPNSAHRTSRPFALTLGVN